MVPSPIPIEIIELDAINALVEKNFVVICTGGGGIPVVRDENGDLKGVNAVIDKDRGTSLLARGLKADLFMISTGVEKVALNFGKPDQKDLEPADAVRSAPVHEGRSFQGREHVSQDRSDCRLY